MLSKSFHGSRGVSSRQGLVGTREKYDCILVGLFRKLNDPTTGSLMFGFYNARNIDTSLLHELLDPYTITPNLACVEHSATGLCDRDRLIRTFAARFSNI